MRSTTARRSALMLSLCGIGLLSACGDDRAPAAKKSPEKESPAKSVTLEAQLAALAEVGLVVNAGVAETELTTFSPRAELESAPFVGLVEVLGFEIENPPYTPICDRLWMCDFERIESDGDYCDVLRRLERMTGGALALSGLADRVDVDAGKAWVEFECAGKKTRWDLEVQSDFLDPAVLLEYDALLAATGSMVRLYINQEDYGQVAFIGAFAPEQKAAFDALTRIRLKPMAGFAPPSGSPGGPR
jgi:hypothetical protein